MPTITNMGEANTLARKHAKVAFQGIKMMINAFKAKGDHVVVDQTIAPGKYKISFGMDAAGHDQVTLTPGTE